MYYFNYNFPSLAEMGQNQSLDSVFTEFLSLVGDVNQPDNSRSYIYLPNYVQSDWTTAFSAITNANPYDVLAVLKSMPSKILDDERFASIANLALEKGSLEKGSQDIPEIIKIIVSKINDTKFWLNILVNYPTYFKYFPTEIMNEEICQQAVSNDFQNFKYVPQEWQTIELVLSYMGFTKDPLVSIREDLQDHPDVVIAIVKYRDRRAKLYADMIRENTNRCNDYIPEDFKDHPCVIEAASEFYVDKINTNGHHIFVPFYVRNHPNVKKAVMDNLSGEFISKLNEDINGLSIPSNLKERTDVIQAFDDYLTRMAKKYIMNDLRNVKVFPKIPEYLRSHPIILDELARLFIEKIQNTSCDWTVPSELQERADVQVAFKAYETACEAQFRTSVTEFIQKCKLAQTYLTFPDKMKGLADVETAFEAYLQKRASTFITKCKNDVLPFTTSKTGQKLPISFPAELKYRREVEDAYNEYRKRFDDSTM